MLQPNNPTEHQKCKNEGENQGEQDRLGKKLDKSVKDQQFESSSHSLMLPNQPQTPTPILLPPIPSPLQYEDAAQVKMCCSLH